MGRAGDIIISLPAMKHIFEATGNKPVMVTSSKFSPILDGVSYVEPMVVTDDKGDNYDEAKKFCARVGLKPRFLRWWMSGDKEDWEDLPISENDKTVTFKGKSWRFNFDKWPNFQSSIWDRTGVPLELMNKLPLVFDRRDKKREQELVRSALKRNKNNLPVLLYNFSGHSSPFAARPEILNELSHWDKKFFMVDLSNFQCERFYDLLGLFDVSSLLVTIDTGTLHLAAASSVKMIAFTNMGWSSSVPAKNCICNIKYDKAAKSLKKFNLFVSSALNT